MSNIVIIGQSPAIPPAIIALREDGQDRHLVLLSTDGFLPYDRSLLPAYMARRIPERNVFCAPEDFYKEQRVDLIRDKEIARINTNRRKVFLSDKVQLDYDVLILTDVPQVRLPEIKGNRKLGIFHLARLDAARRMIKYLPQTDTIFVVPSSLRGIELALVFRSLGKDVVMPWAGEALLSGLLSEEGSLRLLERVEKSGVRVLPNNAIEDILGDAEVKAVRLKTGKVMACEMVVLEAAVPDFRFLADGELLLQDRCCVHTNMRTNVPSVYAVDAMMEMLAPRVIGGYDTSAPEARAQGRCAALNILGRDDAYQPAAIDETATIRSLFPEEEPAEAEKGVS